MKKGKTQVQEQIIKKQKISKSNPMFNHTLRSSCDALFRGDYDAPSQMKVRLM